jgi:hypothetical protein
LIQLSDGEAEVGDFIWLITVDGLIFLELISVVNNDMAVFNGWHCMLCDMKKHAFIDKRKAEMVYKLKR